MAHQRIRWLLYLGLLILYGSVGFQSFGYDDEFFNISVVEKYGLGAIDVSQRGDVHPPGQLVVNWALYSLLGDWRFVRLACAIFTASILIYAIDSTRKRYGSFEGMIALLLLGLNPAILLWCTGLRWYAFFVPILVWTSITPQTERWWYWTKLFASLLVLGYLGYAVFILAPALLVLYWKDCRAPTRDKLKQLAIQGAVAAALYAHQAKVFLDVHLGSKGTQVSSVGRSLLGFAIANVGNQGVFPVSLGGALSAIGSTGIMALGIWHFIKRQRANEQRGSGYFLSYWIAIGTLVLSGLAGKFRNLVTASPFQALWFSTLEVEASQRKALMVFIALLACGNGLGVANVVRHSNTTKNSWNLPVSEVLETAAKAEATCKGDLLLLTHDPTLSYVLEKQQYTVLSSFVQRIASASVLTQPHRCLMAIKTYVGGMSTEQVQSLYGSLEKIGYMTVSAFSIGRDADYAVKRMLDARYPEYQVELKQYEHVTDLEKLEAWLPQKSPSMAKQNAVAD